MDLKLRSQLRQFIRWQIQNDIIKGLIVDYEMAETYLEEMEKYKPRIKGKFPFRQEWQTICSQHSGYDENCMICNSGEWIPIWKTKLYTLTFKISPRLWNKMK